MIPGKKIVVSVLLSAIITSGVFLKPRPAEADILDTVAGISCDIYSATVGKVLGAVEDFASDLLGNAAKGKRDELIGKVADKLPDIPGIGSVSSVLGLGGTVPVSDEATRDKLAKEQQKTKTALKEQQDKLDCQKQVKLIALQILKKRILEAMVDDVIKWIQGDGDPKFITNLGGFLEEAGQAAVGDLAQELGFASICSPFRLNLNLRLEQKTFRNAVSCTLDQIVSNFEDFRENFEAGGWLGYQELLKPQNNPSGVAILAQAELERRIAAEQERAKLEATIGEGFTGQTNCNQWKGSGQAETGLSRYAEIIYDPAQDGGSLPTPYNQPPAVITVTRDGRRYDIIGPWRCAAKEVVTPSIVASQATKDAISKEYDYIANADDLSDYAAAISDAVVNRLTKETVTGLKGLFKGDKSPARGQSNYQIPASVNAASNIYNQNSVNQYANQATQNQLAIMRVQLQNAGKYLNLAKEQFVSAETANNGAVAAYGDIIGCYQTKPASATTTAAIAAATNLLQTATSTIRAHITDQLLRTDALIQVLPNYNPTNPNPAQAGEIANLYAESDELSADSVIYNTYTTQALSDAQINLSQCQG